MNNLFEYPILPNQPDGSYLEDFSNGAGSLLPCQYTGHGKVVVDPEGGFFLKSSYNATDYAGLINPPDSAYPLNEWISRYILDGRDTTNVKFTIRFKVVLPLSTVSPTSWYFGLSWYRDEAEYLSGFLTENGYSGFRNNLIASPGGTGSGATPPDDTWINAEISFSGTQATMSFKLDDNTSIATGGLITDLIPNLPWGAWVTVMAPQVAGDPSGYIAIKSIKVTWTTPPAKLVVGAFASIGWFPASGFDDNTPAMSMPWEFVERDARVVNPEDPNHDLASYFLHGFEGSSTHWGGMTAPDGGTMDWEYQTWPYERFSPIIELPNGCSWDELTLFYRKASGDSAVDVLNADTNAVLLTYNMANTAPLTNSYAMATPSISLSAIAVQRIRLRIYGQYFGGAKVTDFSGAGYGPTLIHGYRISFDVTNLDDVKTYATEFYTRSTVPSGSYDETVGNNIIIHRGKSTNWPVRLRYRWDGGSWIEADAAYYWPTSSVEVALQTGLFEWQDYDSATTPNYGEIQSLEIEVPVSVNNSKLPSGAPAGQSKKASGSPGGVSKRKINGVWQ